MAVPETCIGSSANAGLAIVTVATASAVVM